MQNNEQSPSLRDILYLLFKYKWTIILFTVSSITVAAIYSYTFLPKYRATSKIIVQIEKEDTSPVTGVIKPSGTITTMKTSDITNSELELLHGRHIAEKIFQVMEEDILHPPKEVSKSLWKKIKQKVKNSLALFYDYLDTILWKMGLKKKLTVRENAILNIQNSLRAEIIENSTSIRVSYTSSENPEMAAKIVNTAVALYMKHRINVHRSSNALDFFLNQTKVFRSDLEKAEKQIKDFKNKWNISAIDEQRSHLLQLNTDLQTELDKTDVELARLNRKVRSIKDLMLKEKVIHNDLEITSFSSVLDSLKLKLIELKLRKSDLSLKYPEDNILVLNINKEIHDVETELKKDQAKVAISSDIDALRSKRQTLINLLDKSDSQLKRINVLEHNLRDLTRHVQQAEDLYNTYFEKTEESRIRQAMDTAKISNVKVIEAAYPPILPVRTIRFIPQKIFNIILSSLIGIFASISLISLREVFDHSFKSADEMEKYLELPVLGTISKSKDESYGSFNEEFKRLMAAINQSLKNKNFIQSILIASSTHKEGSSLVSKYLSSTMAEKDDSRILFLDFDCRSSSDNQKKKLYPGLSDFLIEEHKIRSIIRKTKHKNLFLLPLGRNNCDPYWMIHSKRFPKLLQELKSYFSYILIDTSPIQYYPESVILASKVDAVILVVEAEGVRREIVVNTKKKLDSAGANTLGVIYNKKKYYIPQFIYNLI